MRWISSQCRLHLFESCPCIDANLPGGAPCVGLPEVSKSIEVQVWVLVLWVSSNLEYLGGRTQLAPATVGTARGVAFRFASLCNCFYDQSPKVFKLVQDTLMVQSCVDRSASILLPEKCAHTVYKWHMAAFE